MMKSWPTPSIVIEDVDQMKVTKLEFRRPSLCPNSTPAKLHQICTAQQLESEMMTSSSSTFKPPIGDVSPVALIQPEIEAYVTPLSLCSPPPQEKELKEKEAMAMAIGHHHHDQHHHTTCSEEGSFTSVDIGGSSVALNHHHYHPTGDQSSCWNSWNDSDMSGHYQSAGDLGCCFDFKTGLKSVTRAVAGCAGNPSSAAGQQHHHAIDMSDVGLPVLTPRTPQPGRVKRKPMSRCSTIAVVFLAVVILALIAVAIAMYIEFVTKPLASRSALQMNETVTICDLLINGCAEDGNGTAPEVTPAPLMLDKNKNKTSPAALPSSSDSGRIQAQFSSNFTSQINQIQQQQTSKSR